MVVEPGGLMGARRDERRARLCEPTEEPLEQTVALLDDTSTK